MDRAVRICEEALTKWALNRVLGARLALFVYWLWVLYRLEVEIISGYRSRADQERLRREGRPTAPDELSTHRTCPASGVDIRVRGVLPSPDVKMKVGVAAGLAGLRWGGGSTPDSEGIPSDWNHLDLGPRTDRVAQEYRATTSRVG